VCVLVGTALFALLLPVVGLLCDRIGATTVFLTAVFWLGTSSLIFFPMVNTKQTALLLVAAVAMSFGLAGTYGPVAGLISQLFPANLRFSGSALGYQIATLVAGAPAPFLAVAIYGSTGSSWGITGYMLVAVLVSGATGLILSRQGSKSPVVSSTPFDTSSATRPIATDALTDPSRGAWR
jgi:MFS family permease